MKGQEALVDAIRAADRLKAWAMIPGGGLTAGPFCRVCKDWISGHVHPRGSDCPVYTFERARAKVKLQRKGASRGR